MPLSTGTGPGGARRGAGRPKGSKNKVTEEQKLKLWELAMAAAPDALLTLVEVARDKSAPPAARVSASNSILDRALGKPAQAVEHSGPDGTPIPFDGFELTVIAPADAPFSDGN
jgi:hypothetical protein